MQPAYHNTGKTLLDVEPSRSGNPGEIWYASTDLKNRVEVWRPGNFPTAERHWNGLHLPLVQEAHWKVLSPGQDLTSMTRDGLLFCHGHSLGTYARFGYSVFGGTSLNIVLRDEYNGLPPGSLMGAKAGDIIVWYRDGRVVHSALLEIVSKDNPRPETTKISSKDTFSGFSHWLMDYYCNLWGKEWRIFKRKPPIAQTN